MALYSVSLMLILEISDKKEEIEMPIKIGELRLYDLEELSEKLQVNVRSLRRWIREGKIKAKKVGVKYYITEQSLKEYFEKSDNIG